VGAPDKNYRANPTRSILVGGEINAQLLLQLTPKILELRSASGEPITVYIDSNGGSVRIADMIRGLLNAPDQNGSRCRIITVSTGHAESAAADLLATGDYAIAYPHCSIWYHGTRQAVLLMA
jgi:ATP-dependent protease ClpP protease subunit